MREGHFPRAITALETLAPQRERSYIDLGCGNGWAARWMHDAAGDPKQVVGVDVAANMIQRAVELTPQSNRIVYQRASFEDLPFADETFHGAFSMEALYYSTCLDHALLEIRRVLQTNGAFVFCTDFFQENPFCHDWPEGLGIPMELLSEAEWQERFSNAGFEVSRTFRCLDRRPAASSKDAETLQFRTTIGALGILAVKPGGSSRP